MERSFIYRAFGRKSSLIGKFTPASSSGDKSKKSKKKSDKEKTEEKKAEVPEIPLFVAEFLGKLLSSQKYCDVEFIIGPDDAGEAGTDELKTFKAHKVVLAAHSPLFETMLYGVSQKISTLNEGPLQVRIKDSKPKAFEALLKAIYTDKVDINDDNLEDWTIIGKKYQIEKIQLACATYMEQGINIKNVCQMFETAARLLGDEKFGMNFIRENTVDVFKSESFLKLSSERLEVILADDKLSIDETDLFDAVIKWGKAECKRKSLPNNTVGLKSILKDILSLVRFPIMELTDIAITVGPSQLVPEERLLVLYQYLSMIESEKDDSNDKKENSDEDQVAADEKAKKECKEIIQQWYNIKQRTGGFATKETNLLDRKYKKDVYKFFNIRPGGRLVFKLLYRGSRDGFNASAFHSKCDGKPKTLTVVKAMDSKNIFGGYFDGKWAQSGSYISSPSWLFSLVNRYNKPVKLMPSTTSSNTYVNGSYGPTWGGGHDLHINDRMQSANNYSSPSTYRTFAPGYASLGVNYDNSLLAGSSHFKVEEIEVLQIVKITKVKQML